MPATIHFTRRGFTLIELLAVMVILSVLAGVAVGRYFDYRERSQEAADQSALQTINDALRMSHLDRLTDPTSTRQPITALAQAPTVIQFDELPRGWTISGATVTDQRGVAYQLVPETDTAPARLAAVDPNAAPGDPGDDDDAAAAVAPVTLLLFLAPFGARPSRRTGA